MTRLFSILLFLSALPSAFAANWYVRPTDGGTRWSAEVPSGQCNGHADVAYPGSGTNQACAFKDVRYLWAEGGADTSGSAPSWGWVVGPGDFVLIHGMNNRVGYDGPNPADSHGLSIAGDPYTSVPPMPSGTSANPIVIAGDSVTTSGLFGGYGAKWVFNLTGTSYVTIRDLDLTDHSQCSRYGQGVQCSGNYPLDDWGQNGILTSNTTHDITLTNLAIHGFTSDAIRGPIGGTMTLTHVRMTANGSANWDFDDGSNTPMGTGTNLVHMNDVTIEWAGCTEEYPITHALTAYQCWDQNHAGYGDGLGTPDTSNLSFDIQNSTFRYNVQDGFDTLHVVGGTESIHNSQSYGNSGQQWKMGKMSSVNFTNNLTVHNCNRMSADFPGISPGFNAGIGPLCRASGDGIALIVTQGSTYVFENNTYVGYGSTTFDMPCDRNGAACSVSDSPITFRNNLLIGYPNPIDSGRLPGDFYYDSTAVPHPFAANDHNIWYNFRNPVAGSTSVDPLFVNEPSVSATFVEASLDNFNFHLASGSPAIGAGATISGVTTDFAGATRPSPPSIGAYEYAAAPPSVTGDTNTEHNTDWIQDGNAGDTGGPSSNDPLGTFTFTPGSPGVFSIAGADAYDNSYWYRPTAATTAANDFVYSFQAKYQTTADLNASQGLEFELHKIQKSAVFNMAWQCDLKDTHVWRTFDYAAKAWVATSIACPLSTFTPGAFTSISTHFTTTANTVTHVSLTVNGTTYPVNVTRPSVAITVPGGVADVVNQAFQLDSDGGNPPTPYAVSVQNMNVTYSTVAPPPPPPPPPPTPTLASISITLASPLAYNATATVGCATRMSDGSPGPACSGGSLSSTDVTKVTVSGLTVTAVNAGGPVNIQYTQGGIHSNIVAVTVSPAPTGPTTIPKPPLSGNIQLGMVMTFKWQTIGSRGDHRVIPSGFPRGLMVRYGNANGWLYRDATPGTEVIALASFFGGTEPAGVTELDLQAMSLTETVQ